MHPTRSAVIVIRRHTNFWMGGLRDIVIRIDGRRVGKVKRGEAAELVVDPGEYLVTVSMDWVRSRPVRQVWPMSISI